MIDFTPTDEQADLQAAMRSLLASECPTSLLRAHMDDRGAAETLWAHLREWVAIGEGPLADLVLVALELGYVAAPGPFTASALALPLVRLADDALADRVAAGEAVATVAAAGTDGEWWAAPRAGDTFAFVLDADRADVVVRVGAGGSIGCTTATSMEEIATLDSTRRVFTATLAPPSPGEVVIGDDAYLDWLRRATVVVAAEAAGTARRLLDMSVAYAKERVQFDVPIGSFQAIQHKLADMAVSVERATAAVAYAAMAMDAGEPERFRAVHAAKASAGHAATHCARQAIQTHGGIGYTWDHDVHLFMRRAYSSAHLFGTADRHHDLLGALIFALE